MISKISLSIANYLKKSEPDHTPAVAVMSYSLYILLHATFTVVLLLIISIIIGLFYETLGALVFFMLLRIFGGGYHLHSSKLCTVLSIVVICSAPLITVSQYWIIVINIINILLILIYSPRNFKGYSRISEKYFPIMKLVTILIAGANFYWQSSTLLVVTAVFCLLLIPNQEGGENK